jgi:hypothetical protein
MWVEVSGEGAEGDDDEAGPGSFLAGTFRRCEASVGKVPDQMKIDFSMKLSLSLSLSAGK